MLHDSIVYKRLGKLRRPKKNQNERIILREDYKFKSGDLVKAKEEIANARIWMVVDTYISERSMKCVMLVDPSTGECGYFLELEMEKVDEAR